MESFDDGSKGSGALNGLARFVTGARSKFAVVLLFMLASGALLGSGLTAQENNSPTALLPDSAESTTVAAISQTLPSSGVSPAFVVLSADKSTLRANNDQASNDVIKAVQDFSITDQPLRATFSDDSTISLIVVPLDADTGQDEIKGLRAAIAKATPDSITAQVTGGPAFQADLAGVFAGADVTLLITTASVVALLLLVTYRSPWLWLVPLTVVAIADRVAAYAVAGATQLFDYTVDGSTIGITSVLVFGAGTNYALLLIARYREELRRHEDRHAAMRAALGQAAPAILASAGTVVLALLMLSFADSPSNRALGYSGAIGIGVAVLYGLVMLPAAMVLFGRKLFWPFVPKLGEPDPAQRGVWAKVGARVVAKPVAFATGTIAFLVILAVAGAGLNIGLSQNERFRETPEAVLGQETLAKAFPAGAAEPTVVLTTPKNLEKVQASLQKTDNVAQVQTGAADDSWASLNVVLESNRGTPESADTVKELRETLGEQYGDDVLVGGADAQDLDSRSAAVSDFALIVPLVLLCVFAVLLLLLRSLIAAVTLVTTVVASSVSAFGIGWFISKHLFDFPALDLTVPLFAFIFLVALGVDYNIFLTTRAREEAHSAPVGQAMTTALAVTGGVITSAGILLAAVFAVLGVLPLITLTQIGVIVGLGVLIDTLFVRSLLVPALATLLGEKFWWPSHPHQEKASERQ
jgi:RND superfamily putative drug exporter